MRDKLKEKKGPKKSEDSKKKDAKGKKESPKKEGDKKKQSPAKENVKSKVESESSDERSTESELKHKRVGREQFRIRNDRADDSDPDSQLSAEPKKKPKKKEKEKTEFDESMDKFKTCCSEKVMKIANLIMCILLFLVELAKITYMADNGFDTFFLIHVFNLIFFTVILAASEQAFGEAYMKLSRTYFNFLDLSLGRGLFLGFLCIMCLEQRDKNEELFVYIGFIIAMFNMAVGYNDRTHKLPINLWGDGEESDEEAVRSKKKQSKKAGELNQLKEDVRKEKEIKELEKEVAKEDKRKKKGKEEEKKEEEDESSSISDSQRSSEPYVPEIDAPDDDFYKEQVRWEDGEGDANRNVRRHMRKMIKKKLRKKEKEEEEQKRKEREDREAEEERLRLELQERELERERRRLEK